MIVNYNEDSGYTKDDNDEKIIPERGKHWWETAWVFIYILTNESHFRERCHCHFIIIHPVENQEWEKIPVSETWV